MNRLFAVVPLLVVMALFALAGERGELSPVYGPSEGEASRMVAGWYDMRALDISGESGDVVVTTAYSGLVCIGIVNGDSSAVAQVLVKTKSNSSDTVTVTIAASSALWPLPEIHTIIKTGTSDNLILMFQKR